MTVYTSYPECLQVRSGPFAGALFEPDDPQDPRPHSPSSSSPTRQP